MPNKKTLLEAIDKKLSGGVETIESLVNDIALLTENLNKAEKLRKEAEDKLEAMNKKLTESSESAGTTESSKSDVSESIKKLVTILQSSNNVIECMKKELKSEKDLSKNLKAGAIRARSNIERLQTEAKRIQARNEVLEADCKAYLTANKRLHESLEEAKKENSLLQESLNASKKLIESKNSKVNKEMTESIKGYKDKIQLLESNNSRLMNESAILRSKYIESMALAYGISLDALKAKVKPNSTPAMIESAAKSIRELEDARRIALSDPIKLGTKVESSKVQFEDPELSRAGRIASLLI
jgi:chromosome segregation ATPase